MALYTYKENVDQRDRTAEISFDRTDGSRARLIKGKAADLTADEVGRLSKYIVLEAGGASSDVQPLPQSVYTDPTTGRISPSLLPDVPRAVAGDTLPRPSGVAFPFSIVAPDPGPGAPNRYNSFPGQVLCANGEWLVTYRQALTHNVANPTGTTESILLQQRSLRRPRPLPLSRARIEHHLHDVVRYPCCGRERPHDEGLDHQERGSRTLMAAAAADRRGVEYRDAAASQQRRQVAVAVLPALHDQPVVGR
jgi:hypothetical protein